MQRHLVFSFLTMALCGRGKPWVTPSPIMPPQSITTLRQYHLYRKNYIAIGNTLLKHPHFQMSMLYFPLLRTVHATFIAHGAPSVTYHRLEAIAPVLITSTIITSTSTFLHRFNCLLFFVSLHLLMLDTFPRSNNPIRHIYL